MKQISEAIQKKDAELFAEIRRLQDGRSYDFNRLYELTKRYLYKIIYDIVRDSYVTEDLLQETYLTIYNKITSLQEPDAFYVWAGRIATNKTLRYIHKHRHEVLVSADEEGGTDYVFDEAQLTDPLIPEDMLISAAKRKVLAEALDRLSTEQRIAVQLFYYEERSVREIAAELECSTEKVKGLLFRARQTIKNAVSQRKSTVWHNFRSMFSVARH